MIQAEEQLSEAPQKHWRELSSDEDEPVRDRSQSMAEAAAQLSKVAHDMDKVHYVAAASPNDGCKSLGCRRFLRCWCTTNVRGVDFSSK